MVTPPGKAPGPLAAEVLALRARRLRLVLTDCDGVLTDASAYYSAEGELLKRFSLRDGMGMERLRNAGVMTAIVTRERSEPVRRRREKLKLPFHFDGIEDKAATLPRISRETGVSASEMAYIGDDVNDLDILEIIAREGLTGCPADAIDEVRALAHFVAPCPGGHGAFRAFAEWLIALRDSTGPDGGS